ncbi:hypothetical protein E2C01_029608 [Portunus trituberculatus]|uniref:Uncharacterized protein n=1 Tax=Portunus trituberculatus TaxID=210409 RepID=A0A5B7ESU9_PORTR|nr:hypothetical protein [Portunus trituberculatus]
MTTTTTTASPHFLLPNNCAGQLRAPSRCPATSYAAQPFLPFPSLLFPPRHASPRWRNRLESEFGKAKKLVVGSEFSPGQEEEEEEEECSIGEGRYRHMLPHYTHRLDETLTMYQSYH